MRNLFQQSYFLSKFCDYFESRGDYQTLYRFSRVNKDCCYVAITKLLRTRLKFFQNKVNYYQCGSNKCELLQIEYEKKTIRIQRKLDRIIGRRIKYCYPIY